MGGIVSAAFWGIGAAAASWAVLEEFRFRRSMPGLRRSHMIAITGVVLVATFWIGLCFFFSLAPTPVFVLENKPYNFADGVIMHGVPWEHNRRAFSLSITNPWASTEMRDVGVNISTPALIVHSGLVFDQGSVIGAELANAVTELLWEDKGVVTKKPKLAYTNMLYLKAKRIKPGGNVTIDVALQYDDSSKPYGVVNGRFSFKGDFGRSVTTAKGFKIEVAPGEARNLSLLAAEELPGPPIIFEPGEPFPPPGSQP